MLEFPQKASKRIPKYYACILAVYHSWKGKKNLQFSTEVGKIWKDFLQFRIT
jgi:hypothetical protein